MPEQPPSTDPLGHLEAAREAIAAERDRSVSEQEAFRAFLERIEALDPAPEGSSPSPSDTPEALRVRDRTSSARTDEIWSAYCETVLAVPHFETDYDETPIEHLRAELGDDVAALVLDPDALTEYHTQVLTARVESSIAAREEQLEKMDEESAMMDRAEDLVDAATQTLAAHDTETIISMSEEQVADAATDVEHLMARCDRLLTERQELLDSRPETKRWDRETTVDYLYRDCAVTYPVIVAVTTIRDRLESRKDDLDAVMAP